VKGDLAAAVDVDHGCAVKRALVRLGPLAGGEDGGCSRRSTCRHAVLDAGGVQAALVLPGAVVVDELVAEPQTLQLER
jgi:hypothetical protein